MKNLKLTLYSLFVFVFLFGIAGIGLGLSRFRISIETEAPNTASLPVMEPPIPPPATVAKKLVPGLSATPALPTPAVLQAQKDPVQVSARQGNLRVSNPTEHPVRVALLTRQIAQKTYGEPIHWDFSPMEGATQGLKVSLPQGDLRLKKGDILVAFAEDGSRLYWGPYVVGETPAPIWNAQKAEWQLVLQP